MTTPMTSDIFISLLEFRGNLSIIKMMYKDPKSIASTIRRIYKNSLS